jgi:hypothetical protein
MAAFESGARTIVLDLSRLEFMDCTAAQLALMATGIAAERRLEFFLVRGPERILRTCDLAGITAGFRSPTDLQTAILPHLACREGGADDGAQCGPSVIRMRARQAAASKTTGSVVAQKSSSVSTNRWGASTCGK